MRDKDSLEILAVWAATATSIVVIILPWLQFIAVCLAVYISLQKIYNKKKNENI
jgi:hypothetical protein